MTSLASSKRTIAVAGLLLAMCTWLSAQAPMAPTPAPEVAKLSYFVGDWTLDGSIKPSPFGPGGKMTGTDHTEWMDGKFFIVSHETYDSSMGKGSSIAVMGYDSGEKKYTYNSYSSMGEKDVSMGSMDGDTWTWLSDEKINGQPVKGRYTAKVNSPNSYDFKFEMAGPDGSYNTIMEGKATKK